MPTCYVTLSEKVPDLTEEQLFLIRDFIADGLNSKSRLLDRHHIVLRIQRAPRLHMLGDIELEVFSQFFLRRFFSRDRRAQEISTRIKDLLHFDCATWINMMVVGYARVSREGHSYFSDKTSQAKRPIA
jgi:hypothetical protein